MASDVKAVEFLRELSQGIKPIHEALTDSLFLSGSEAYQGALLFYGSVKAASIYDDLANRFPTGSQKKKEAV
jgi:hypothetical protein